MSAAINLNATSFALTPQQTNLFHFTWQDASGETTYQLLEQASPSASFVLVTTLAANATSFDLPVSLLNKLNASYQLQACLNAVCTAYQNVAVSGNLAGAIGYLKASTTDAEDYFGQSIALSADGNTLAIGASGEDSNATGVNGDQTNNSVNYSGAVYVFTRINAIWVQQAYVKASNAGDDGGYGDLFGVSIALSADGNTLAVGANGESSNAKDINGNQADNSATNSGAVYVFARTGSVWTQQAYVKASNTEQQDFFGLHVALSADGNTLAASAIREDSSATGVNADQANNESSNSGAVYVFTRTGTSWTQQAYVKASNTGNIDMFGYSLALSSDGNTLAVGATNESSNSTGVNGNQDNNNAFSSGAVYVFTRTGTAWVQQAYLKASTVDADDGFGISLALSADGNMLAIGASGEDSAAKGVNGNQADNSASTSGAAYVFGRTGSVWAQQAYLKASNSEANDYFGYSLALSADGKMLAVGAYWESSNAKGVNGDQLNNGAINSGAVYVFSLSNAAWVQQHYVKAANTEADDRFGSSLSLSADGSRLAVGVISEDSNATGVNGDQTNNSATQAGAVYIY